MIGDHARVHASRTRGFTLVELLVVIAIVGVLVALLLPAIQAAREAARKANCSSHLRQIGIALENFENVHRAYPAGAYWTKDPNGPKRGSILIRILPYLEEQHLFKAFNFKLPKVEDSMLPGTAVKASSIIVPVYLCPSDDSGSALDDRALHNYSASRGPTAVFTNPECSCPLPWQNMALAPLDEPNNFAGVFTRMGTPCKVRQITDGLSKTIFFGEVRPRCSQHVQNGWAATNDGNGYSTTLVPINYDSCNDASSDPCQRTFNWTTEVGFRSAHSGGAFFLFGDVSVHFVAESIDHQTYQYLGAKGDNQPIRIPF